jgi:hypothetical protein
MNQSLPVSHGPAATGRRPMKISVKVVVLVIVIVVIVVAERHAASALHVASWTNRRIDIRPL